MKSKIPLALLSVGMSMLAGTLYADAEETSYLAKADHPPSPPHHASYHGKDPMGPEDPSYQGMVQASYTYWKVQQLGLTTFSGIYYTTPVLQADATKGTAVSPRIKSQSGFKVAAALFANERNWKLQGEYTWFRNQDKHMNTYVFPHWSAWGVWTAGEVNFGQDQWNNTFMRWDLDLSTFFKPNHYFSVEPFLGVTGAWDRQNFYTYQTSQNEDGGISTNFDLMTLFLDWWCVGPEIGTTGTFYLYESDCMMFDLFGKWGLGVTYQSAKQTYKADNNDTPRRVGTWGEQTVYHANTVFDMKMGLSYAYLFGMRYMNEVRLNVAWDLQVWPNHNNMGTVIGPNHGYSTMSIQGLTVDLGVKF